MLEGSTEIKMLSYRNGYFQGEIKNGRKHGQGILVTDWGQIVVGTWRNDELFGNVFAFLNSEEIREECLPILNYLTDNFVNEQDLFQLKTLSTGANLFKFNDNSNPISLGFVLGKNDKLLSFGTYINDKLQGFGCKFENGAKFQGIFENGFLNGLGMKYSNNKYSFGRFQGGNLVEAIFQEERANSSEEKLKELKRIEHIKSIFYVNSYLKSQVVSSEGSQDIRLDAREDEQQKYLYPTSSAKKTSNQQPSLNMKLTKTNQLGDDFDKKSSKTVFDYKKSKELEEYERASETGKSYGNNNGLSTLKKYKL